MLSITRSYLLFPSRSSVYTSNRLFDCIMILLTMFLRRFHLCFSASLGVIHTSSQLYILHYKPLIYSLRISLLSQTITLHFYHLYIQNMYLVLVLLYLSLFHQLLFEYIYRYCFIFNYLFFTSINESTIILYRLSSISRLISSISFRKIYMLENSYYNIL